MMIENNTDYSRTLKYIIGNDAPSFEIVRDVAKAILKRQPDNVQQHAYDSLEHGTAVLFHGLQMDAYLHAYGRMHQAKLNYAYKHIPETFWAQNEINIIDYGCGLGTGIMCFADFLRKQGFVLKVNTITLIEPSEPTLKRAALHSRLFFHNANIITINKGFDQLSKEDIYCRDDIPTLHILSNVLDLDFDLDNFASLIRNCIRGYNQFVCVGPYFHDYEKDVRMELFADSLNGNDLVYDNSRELDSNEDWTCAICCFNAGEVTLNDSFNADSLILYPIKNWYQSEKVVLYPFNDYEDFKRQFNQGEKVKFYRNQNGLLESFPLAVKKSRRSNIFIKVLVSESCDINNPLHIDVVSIDNKYYYFIDNQWEIEMLLQMNPSFEKRELTNNSKYYKITDLNAFLKQSNNNQFIEFRINQFGYFEATKYIIINGKEEQVSFFIRPGCNVNKPMTIKIVETNHNGNQYYAFIDNQWKYRINCSDVSSHQYNALRDDEWAYYIEYRSSSPLYQQYVRMGKAVRQKTPYRIDIFEYEDFKKQFNNGEKFSWVVTRNNLLVTYAELTFNHHESLTKTIASIFWNKDVVSEKNRIVELFLDTYSGNYSGTLKNVDEIIEL